MDYAELERKMAEYQDMREELARHKENMAMKMHAIEQLVNESGHSYYELNYDKDHLLVAEARVVNKKTFQKEEMAEHMQVEPSAVQRKDFLINKTEKGELTLQKRKEYFSYDQELDFRVKKKKKSKKWKKAHGENVD